MVLRFGTFGGTAPRSSEPQGASWNDQLNHVKGFKSGCRNSYRNPSTAPQRKKMENMSMSAGGE